jgi:hypothetical protein
MTITQQDLMTNIKPSLYDSATRTFWYFWRKDEGGDGVAPYTIRVLGKHTNLLFDYNTSYNVREFLVYTNGHYKLYLFLDEKHMIESWENHRKNNAAVRLLVEQYGEANVISTRY